MMAIELKAGDIVRIEGAYFKNDNGLYFVKHCPGDAGWLGKDYSLHKICKNGKISTAKYFTAFWPLMCCANDRMKNAEARAWNEEHATITKVDNINAEFVVEYFKGEVEKCKGLYEDYSWRFGAENEVALSYKETMEHYQNVVARMACTCEDMEQEEYTEVEETTEEIQELETQEIIKEAKEGIETSVEEVQEAERTYYHINEETARIAKEINSFSEYKAGSATAEYRHYCGKAYDILDKIRTEKPEQAEHAEKKVDYYCRKLAEYYNDYYRNEASCPSVMTCGPANFPVKKKNRQNSRRETLHNTWEYLENYLRKIEDILTCEQPIKSGDSDAIEKLTTKIERLEAEHKLHLEANRYYKKNGTLKGFDGLGEKEVAEIEDFIKRNPFSPPFFTNNETANIRRYKERLEKLIKEKEAGTIEQPEADAENNGLFTVVENKEIMRLQILFDGIPPASARDILKRNGFRWSPKNEAWQRQLTDNARYTYKNIKGSLKDAMSA